MAEQLFIGNFGKGLTTNRIAAFIDNDAFPQLLNAYIWRGRARRKRGTGTLDRLHIQIQMALVPNNFQKPAIVLVAGSGNLITDLSLEVNSDIVPKSISLMLGADTYTEPNTPDGTLLKNGFTDPGSIINYSTGAFTLAGGGVGTVTGTFSYYPDLPVLGLQDFVSNNSNNEYPLLISFDPVYAYQLRQIAGAKTFYNISYYKITNNPVRWSNSDDNQFWTTNYQSAFWATNNKPGFHFLTATQIAGSPGSDITFNFKSNGVNFTNLIVGDVLWFNEWTASTVNGLNGSVTNAADAINGNYVVSFVDSNGVPLVVTAAGTGIVVMLTNSLPGQDGIRWYDGDPTSATGLPTGTGLGWVNFSPVLTETETSINDLKPGKYYLVGALAIVNFKDRLLFFGPQIQTAGGLVYQRPIQDTVIFSWNGTPYYNALVPTSPTTNEGFDPTAYYVDQPGKGGYQPAGVSKPVVTVSANGDVLLVGFGGTGLKTRLIYTGNDIQPFEFYLINSDFPSSCTFSSITMDQVSLEIGQYGLTATSQQACERIDLVIPDLIFQIQAVNNGVNRVNSARDFFREWIYFSFPTGNGQNSGSSWKYPSNTLFYNYRDATWAIFRENFTKHGTFRSSDGYTWLTLPFKTWNDWLEPWGSSAGTAQFPTVIAGNPQGYVLKRIDSAGEVPSGSIKAVANNGAGFTRITSPNHCTNIGDYLYISGVINLLTSDITGITLGTETVISTINTFAVADFITINGVMGTTELNGNTYDISAVTGTTITIEVDSTNFTPYLSNGTVTSAFNGLIGMVIATPDANTFDIDLIFPTFAAGGYLGLGQYTRLSQPLIQTKQFQPYWNEGRKARIGVQKYLFDYTDDAQVTVNIYLSQDPNTVFNMGPILPNVDVTNSSLIYSQIVYTCPESSNIGLTPFTSNLQMPSAFNQQQIWHRMNTSLIGDTIQLGVTLSDAQMRDLNFATAEITLHAIQMNAERGPLLA